MSKSFIFIFPGQGSQKIGMGLDLYRNHHIAREVFDEVDETLNQKLSKIMFEGSESDLKFTPNTQPALMCVSIAIVKILEYELKRKISDFVEVVLGHSLGEYSSLCSVNSINLEDTSKILRIRGDAMQNSVEGIQTTMVAVIGLDIKEIEEKINDLKLTEDSVCEIANDNCPGQVILSGTKDGVDLVCQKLKDSGARSLINLNVGAPFHCSLMKPASLVMADALSSINFRKPETKFVSNVTADFEDDKEKINRLLVEQIFSKVRWRESILKASSLEARKIVEIGSGKVLSGINKRIGVNLEIQNISTLKDLDSFLSDNKSDL